MNNTSLGMVVAWPEKLYHDNGSYEVRWMCKCQGRDLVSQGTTVEEAMEKLHLTCVLDQTHFGEGTSDSPVYCTCMPNGHVENYD